MHSSPGINSTLNPRAHLLPWRVLIGGNNCDVNHSVVVGHLRKTLRHSSPQWVWLVTVYLHPQGRLEVCQSLQTHSTFIHSAGWKSASLYKHIQPSSTGRVGSLPVSTNTFNLHPQCGLEVCQSLQTHSTFIHSVGWKSASLYKHIQPSSTVWVGSPPVSVIYHINRDHTMATYNWHNGCWARSYMGY